MADESSQVAFRKSAITPDDISATGDEVKSAYYWQNMYTAIARNPERLKPVPKKLEPKI